MGGKKKKKKRTVVDTDSRPIDSGKRPGEGYKVRHRGVSGLKEMANLVTTGADQKIGGQSAISYDTVEENISGFLGNAE